MKLHKRLIVSTIAFALAGQFSALPARDSIDQRLTDEAMPMVVKTTDSFLVEAPFINNLVVMNVRVYNQQGEQVLYVRSYGEPVELLAADLPDGKYSYQVNSVFTLDKPIGEGADYLAEGMSRKNGEFDVENSEVVMGEEFSMYGSLIDYSLAIIDMSLSILITNAQAQDLQIEDSSPSLEFLDTTAGSKAIDFKITGNVNSGNTFSVLNFSYDLVGGAGTLYGATFGEDATLLHNSMRIETSGDISWANSGMFFDRSDQILSIGSKASGVTQDLFLSNAKPGLRFHDEADTSEVELELSAGDFRVWGRADDSGAPWHIPFRIDVNAPTDSLTILSDGTVTAKNMHIGADTPTGHSLMITSEGPGNPPEIDLNNPGNSGVEIEMSDSRLRFNLDSDGDDSPDEYDVLNINKFAPANTLSISAAGNIGNGIFFPLAPIHVQRSNGTAKVLVEETNAAAAPRTLFQLSNNGNTKFGVLNTEAGVEWAFANPGTAFRISRQGSGQVEMELFNNGDMTIAGVITENSDVNTKQDIEPVNGQNILEKITRLEISEWSYKDAPSDRHVGPMAQDFYAAFGLGKTDKGIASLDSSGVALAAIQALVKRNEALEQKNAELSEAVEKLLLNQNEQRKEHADLKAMVIDLQMSSQSGNLLTSLK